MRSSNLVGIVSCNKVGGCEYSILDLIVFTCASSTIDEYDMYGGMMHHHACVYNSMQNDYTTSHSIIAEII